MSKKVFGIALCPGLFALSFLSPLLFTLSVPAHAAQRELQKLTVGYTPVSGAALPFFIAVEEKLFQKHGFEISPVFMGGSPLINAAILAGESERVGKHLVAGSGIERATFGVRDARIDRQCCGLGASRIVNAIGRRERVNVVVVEIEIVWKLAEVSGIGKSGMRVF